MKHSLILLLGISTFLQADLVVLNDSDTGAGSLRAAIASATAGEVITFASELSGDSIALTEELVVEKEIVIDGSTLSEQLTIDGAGVTRVFSVLETGDLSLVSMTIVNGAADDGGGIRNDGTLSLQDSLIENCISQGWGGGILNGAALTLTNSTLAGNSGSKGGGLYQIGTATITGTTFRTNSAREEGGGLLIRGETTLEASLFESNTCAKEGGGIFVRRDTTMTNCTFVDNDGIARGGAIYTRNELTLNFCTITGNKSPSGGALHSEERVFLNFTIAADNGEINFGRSQPHVENRNNFTMGTPSLQILGDYGGPTLTRPPLVGATDLIDQIEPDAITLENDARGVNRLFGEMIDIGAVELQGALEELLRSDDNADDDNDGTPNLVELAIGRDPEVAELNSPQDLLWTSDRTGLFLQFGFNESLASNLILEVRRSTDLINFDDLVISNEMTPFPKIDNGIVSAFDVKLDASNRGFYRVEARRRETSE